MAPREERRQAPRAEPERDEPRGAREGGAESLLAAQRVEEFANQWNRKYIPREKSDSVHHEPSFSGVLD